MGTALSYIKQTIKEHTVDLGPEEYVEFLRSLAVWAEEEANLLEYLPDYDTEVEWS